MEGILLMLLYLAIGFFKNRSDKMKRREIESDPNWDTEKKSKTDFNFDKFLTNIIDDSNFVETEKIDKNLSVLDEKETPKSFNQSKFEKKENNLKKAKDDNLDENILKEKEVVLNTIDTTKKDFVKRNSLFKNHNSLKKAIIFKEIIDKPLGLR